MQYKDYYATLGVSKTATQDEIRKAFRKLARLHHPDVAKDKKGAEAKFKEINEANEVLSDAEKRKRYDELGSDWDKPGRHGPAHGGGGFDFSGGEGQGGFSDFFEAFFGGRGGGKRGRGFGGFAQRGEDVEFDLPVTIEEILSGGKKAFSIERGGRPETMSVTVPKGVRPGQKIRLSGQGGVGSGGAQNGDMYLKIKLAPHSEYCVEGSDLIHTFPVSIRTAVLGGEAEVETPDGAVKLKVPAGTQPGQKFRLKGRGLPSGKDTRGDFFAEAKVTIPTTLTPEEREIWEKL